MQEQLGAGPLQLVVRIALDVGDDQVFLAQVPFVGSGRRAEDAPRTQARGQVSLAAADEPARVQLLASQRGPVAPLPEPERRALAEQRRAARERLQQPRRPWDKP